MMPPLLVTIRHYWEFFWVAALPIHTCFDLCVFGFLNATRSV